MLDTIDVENYLGATLSLSLEDDSNGFSVQSVEGLEPVKATLASTTFANLDGEQYQSGRRETRNVIITLGLSPDYITWTPALLRQELYNFFMPKTEVTLTFNDDDGRTFVADGVVESFTSPLFVQEPTVQISIICYDPAFREAESTVINGTTVSDSDPTDLYTPITYTGSIPTGILFTLTINVDTVGSFSILNYGPDGAVQTMQYTVNDLVNGDSVIINTNDGEKSVQHNVGAEITTSGLAAIDVYSDWIKLLPGTNNFQVYVPADPISGENPHVPYTIEYTTKYGGM